MVMKFNKKTLVIVIILAITGIWIYFNEDTSSNNHELFKLADYPTEINGYTVGLETFGIKGLNDPIDWFCLIYISKDGKRIFESETGMRIFGYGVDEYIENADDIKTDLLKDYDKDGVPEIAFSTFSGGAHCCSNQYVIELSNPISIMLDLSTESTGVSFIDLNKDGIMEISTADGVFDYWHSGYSTSHRPKVILSLQDGKYKPDPKYMISPAPTDNELMVKVQEFKDSEKIFGGDSSGTWNYVLDLIYSGNIKSAQKYVDLVWDINGKSGDFKTKENFWKELDDEIRSSSYYDDLSNFLNL